MVDSPVGGICHHIFRAGMFDMPISHLLVLGSLSHQWKIVCRQCCIFIVQEKHFSLVLMRIGLHYNNTVLTSALISGMLPVTTLGTLLLLYMRHCLSTVLSFVGMDQLLNWLWTVRAVNKVCWDDPPECQDLLHWHHLCQWPTLHHSAPHFHSHSLPPLRGSDSSIHDPSGPLHRGTGPSLLIHVLIASPFLMVSTHDH